MPQKSTFVGMAVSIYFQGVKRPYFASNRRISLWLDRLAAQHNHSIQELNIIFVSDEELLVMNRQFLDHDYYTDIITFDLGTENKTIQGELYISLDRVKENAYTLGQKYSAEFIRVVAHGLLHLIGFQDKKSEQIVEMRSCENEAIALYLSMNSPKLK
jgi:probable rRNA maturation factor